MSLYRTGLGRARGLGSAKHGVGSFIAERVSSVAMIFLSLWAVWFALGVVAGGYDGARTLLGSPIHAGLAILTLVVGLYHAMLGMKVIIEDYIERPITKATLMILNAFVGWGAAVIATVAILKVTFSIGS